MTRTSKNGRILRWQSTGILLIAAACTFSGSSSSKHLRPLQWRLSTMPATRPTKLLGRTTLCMSRRQQPRPFPRRQLTTNLDDVVPETGHSPVVDFSVAHSRRRSRGIPLFFTGAARARLWTTMVWSNVNCKSWLHSWSWLDISHVSYGIACTDSGGHRPVLSSSTRSSPHPSVATYQAGRFARQASPHTQACQCFVRFEQPMLSRSTDRQERAYSVSKQHRLQRSMQGESTLRDI